MTAAEQAVLDEQNASEQRVVAEQNPLVERARAKVRKIAEEAAAAERQQRERQRQYEREGLVRDVQETLGIRITEADVHLEIQDLRGYERVMGYVKIEGFTFRRGQGNQRSLMVQRTCSRCGDPSWKPIYNLTYLADLQEIYDHDWSCVEPEPEPEPEPEQTDISAAEEGEPTQRAVEEVERWVSPFEKYQEAKEHYKAAVKLRRELQFQRPVEKGKAVKRIIEAKLATSATAAKEMSHEDADFAQFCQSLTDAVIAEMEAREAYFVARKNAGISGAGAPDGDGDAEEAA